MKSRSKIIAFALVSVLIGTFAVSQRLSAQSDASECPTPASGNMLAPEVRASQVVFAALAGENCLRKNAVRVGVDAYGTLLLAGNADLLFELGGPDIALPALHTAVASGESMVFSQETTLVEQINVAFDAPMPEEPAIVHDAALAFRREGTAASAIDPSRFLETRPFSLMTDAELETYCANGACDLGQGAELICTGHHRGLKLLASEDQDALWDTLSSCTPTMEAILTLRQRGVLSGTCSTTMQINEIMATGYSSAVVCDKLLYSDDISSTSDQDAVVVVRHMIREGVDEWPAWISEIYGDIGQQIESFMQGATNAGQ